MNISSGLDLSTLRAVGAVPTLIRASKTFTGAANLGAVGTNELFNVSAPVWITGFFVYCTVDLADAVDGAFFTIGSESVPALFGDYGVLDLDAIDLNDGLDASNVKIGYAENLAIVGAEGQHGGYLLTENIDMTISTQAITGGVLEFYVVYRPLSANGALTLGAGMVAL